MKEEKLHLDCANNKALEEQLWKKKWKEIEKKEERDGGHGKLCIL